MDNLKNEKPNVASRKTLSSSRKFAIPFNIGIEPMKRLLIASFDNDLEYEAIEPQLFDDDINGKGLRVLVYRTDKMVDVYYEKDVKINQETFSVGDGIGVLNETIIEPNQFEIDQNGINLHVAFTDKNQNVIEMKIKENATSKKRMNFLAPVGNDIKHPKQLFLAYMKEFDFVIRNNTTFYARVGQRKLKPSHFPLSRNGEKVFFARYSNNPIVGTLNPPMQTTLVFDCESTGAVEFEDLLVQLHEGKVSQITRSHNNKTVSIGFLDGLPNLFELNENTEYPGNWTYKINDQIITGGEYFFFRKGNKVDIQLKVTRNWTPKNIPLSFQMFTLVVKSFRKWPTTYR
ncbi:MAG: hypothetical protein Q7V19_00655, partial [Bacteroidales bacterium]|nr:hypothetical protein [Bacteroidales bacterium]